VKWAQALFSSENSLFAVIGNWVTEYFRERLFGHLGPNKSSLVDPTISAIAQLCIDNYPMLSYF
jgi:hypothetical protein